MCPRCVLMFENWFMFGRKWLNANVSYFVLARNTGRCPSSPADQSGSDEMTVKCKRWWAPLHLRMSIFFLHFKVKYILLIKLSYCHHEVLNAGLQHVAEHFHSIVLIPLLKKCNLEKSWLKTLKKWSQIISRMWRNDSFDVTTSVSYVAEILTDVSMLPW